MKIKKYLLNENKSIKRNIEKDIRKIFNSLYDICKFKDPYLTNRVKNLHSYILDEIETIFDNIKE